MPRSSSYRSVYLAVPAKPSRARHRQPASLRFRSRISCPNKSLTPRPPVKGRRVTLTSETGENTIVTPPRILKDLAPSVLRIRRPHMSRPFSVQPGCTECRLGTYQKETSRKELWAYEICETRAGRGSSGSCRYDGLSGEVKRQPSCRKSEPPLDRRTVVPLLHALHRP